jgi:hypothetical protein
MPHWPAARPRRAWTATPRAEPTVPWPLCRGSRHVEATLRPSLATLASRGWLAARRRAGRPASCRAGKRPGRLTASHRDGQAGHAMVASCCCERVAGGLAAPCRPPRASHAGCRERAAGGLAAQADRAWLPGEPSRRARPRHVPGGARTG